MRKAPLLLGLSIAALLSATVAGDALAKGKKPKKKAAPVSTAAYFMAADPHVPLAITDQGSFVPFEVPGQRCGDPTVWSTVGSSWQALDAWGQVSGEFKIEKRELYDVTGCYEATMKKESGDEGAKLFVSAGAWKAPKSAEAATTDAQKAAFGAVLDATVKLYANTPKVVTAGKSAFKMAYFTAPRMADDGTHPVDTWAVAAGPMLVFAKLVDGEWKLSHVLPPWEHAQDGIDHFKLLSVFDMNGDGSPEVIVDENNLDGWNDEVFSLVAPSGWTPIVVSPGGSTA